MFTDISAHALLIDPNDSARLYVGTDLGVFVSPDSGATWMQDDDPFANAITESLVVDGNGGANTIYARVSWTSVSLESDVDLFVHWGVAEELA